MRRPKREFTIFSLSALDLFCSAMGAFMVICIILIPYFGRKESVDTTALEQKLAAETRRADTATREAAQLKQEAEKLREQAKSQLLAFFGIVTKVKSITLVVDLSGSIYNVENNPKAKDYRPVVQHVCDTIIDGMKPGQSLQIIGFHQVLVSRFELPAMAGAPVVVSAATQQAAKRFVADRLLEVKGGTPTGPALLKALEQDTDAIFLVTDGRPSDGNRDDSSVCDEVLATMRARNNGRKEIHAIAIGAYNEQPFCTEFLMRLAQQNKGQFLGMPNL